MIWRDVGEKCGHADNWQSLSSSAGETLELHKLNLAWLWLGVIKKCCGGLVSLFRCHHELNTTGRQNAWHRCAHGVLNCPKRVWQIEPRSNCCSCVRLVMHFLLVAWR
jgi:hypothetical protein